MLQTKYITASTFWELEKRVNIFWRNVSKHLTSFELVKYYSNGIVSKEDELLCYATIIYRVSGNEIDLIEQDWDSEIK